MKTSHVVLIVALVGIGIWLWSKRKVSGTISIDEGDIEATFTPTKREVTPGTQGPGDPLAPSYQVAPGARHGTVGFDSEYAN